MHLPAFADLGLPQADRCPCSHFRGLPYKLRAEHHHGRRARCGIQQPYDDPQKGFGLHGLGLGV